MTRPAGFTLLELLVVVTIIAIIGGSVLALSGGHTTDAAIQTTLATQKRLTAELTQYYEGHGRRLPDGFDSLLRDDWSAGASSAVYTSYATPTGALEVMDRTTDASGGPGYPRKVIYTGCDVDQDGMADPGARSQGLTLMSWSGQGVHSLAVARLNAADLAALNRLGITYVWDIAHDKDLADGGLTYVRRTLAVGQPVVILDPGGLAESLGAFTDVVGLTTAQKATQRPHFIVLGVGPRCTAVGDRRGGLHEAPTCPTVVTWITATPRANLGYYDRYMAVVKMPFDGRDVPALAGVLDANGWPSRAAARWYFRNNE